MNPVERHIEFLRVLHKAAPDQIPAVVRGIDALPRVLITDAGACATLLSLAARNLARQMPHAHETAVPALRMAVLALADALQMEFNARDNGEHKTPWHHFKGDQ